MPNLYHVQADDPQGENLDWFVIATTHSEARVLWENEAKHNGFDPSDGVTRIREIPRQLFDETKVRAVGWDELTIVYEPN